MASFLCPILDEGLGTLTPHTEAVPTYKTWVGQRDQPDHDSTMWEELNRGSCIPTADHSKPQHSKLTCKIS